MENKELNQIEKVLLVRIQQQCQVMGYVDFSLDNQPDYIELKAHLRCLRISLINTDDDPFTIYQAGDMTKGKLIEILINSLYEFFKENNIKMQKSTLRITDEYREHVDNNENNQKHKTTKCKKCVVVLVHRACGCYMVILKGD